MQRRLFSTALALAALPACTQTPARPFAPPSPAGRLGGLMEVGVVDRTTGRELPIYRAANGDWWVAGRPGARYAIRVRNRLGERLMAVMSVDGVNVVTGETAGVQQNGYVLAGGERADIAGWRKSDSQIAAFEFTAGDNSYASRTGRPDDVGVIGVAVFRERTAPPPSPPIAFPRRDEHERSSSGAPGDFEARNKASTEALPPPPPGPAAPAAQAAPSADSAMANEPAGPADGRLRRSQPAPSLGTGHGRRETSYIGHTTFERLRTTPDEVVRIRYDSRENLVAAGVIPVTPPPRWPRPAAPSPFPGSDVGYVPDPPPRY